MSSQLPPELVNVLRGQLAEGVVRSVPETETISRLSARFPMGFSGIDWDRVPGCKSIGRHGVRSEVKPSAEGKEHFLTDFIRDAGWDPEDEAVVVGAGVMKEAILLPVKQLLLILNPLTSLPQHSYICDPECNWCICYTFEDEAFYGRAPR